MPARSVVVQLRPGVGQAILPDHRKMLPGIQYVIDWETFTKLSNGARMNIVQTVAVNTDATTTSGSFVPAQTQTSFNQQLNIQNVLVQTSQNQIPWNAGGFSAQGFDGNSYTGISAPLVGATVNNALTGPADERYEWVYSVAALTAGQVCSWSDENNRFITNTHPQYLVAQDPLGQNYNVSYIDTTTTIVGNGLPFSTIGTRQGGFAGIALTTVASGYYCWIQVEGICPQVNVSGATVGCNAGDTLGVPTTGAAGYAIGVGQASKTISNTIVSNTALSNNVFGTALTAVTGTTGTAEVYIRSRRVRQPYVRRLNKN